MVRRPHALRCAALAALLLWVGSAGAVQPTTAPYPNTEGFGVDFEKSEDWYRHCTRVQRLAPRRAQGKPGKRCDATRLYYLKHDQSNTSSAEWGQVRSCAETSGDDAVLMMLYANGYGVARDTNRAIYHACRLDTAKAEMEARVAHLSSSVAADGQPFDLCDHITSGRMGGVCAAIGEERDDRVRAARLDRFAAALAPQARQPFARLRKAADAFAQKSADEVDTSGSGAAGFTFRHTGRRDEEFMETLLKAASGRLPRAGTAQLAELERQLDAQYRKVLGTPSDNRNPPERLRQSTVVRADVRSTGRVWLAYRAAWEAFAAAAHLPADVISIKAMLTRQRIAQLKRI
jgi:hypothetical protein